jgi:diguanylate cyclase
LGHRHRLVEQLSALCHELTAGLTDLAEDDSWTRGQCEAMQSCLAGGATPTATNAKPGTPSVRAVRAASAVLAQTRQRQQQLRTERLAAQDALKHLIQGMLVEVGELGEQTGRFTSATAAHAQTIAAADSLEDLADVVKSLLEDSKSVQAAVSLSQQRLQADSEQAQRLESKVRELEGELRRLSDEVCTDALTKVSNRRGLAQAFEAETSRSLRQGGSPLAVGLIDIDNFKKLNDSLGHAAGDVALKTLAAEVQSRLRPVDHLARFGGEEFVVLLPGTELVEAQQALTRLQRSLTEALFLHEGREVFVTFSAGVTAWRDGETLDAALERADSGLYEAKRTGKNRTCTA